MVERVLDGRYALEMLVGSGGMADVYRAKDQLLERTVAVKILHQQYENDKEFIERFQREAKAAARITHPNIVNVYDVGIAEGRHYIVMEYVPGRTLKERIEQQKQREQLEKQLAALESRIRKEKQPKKKFELVRELKKIQESLTTG